MSGDQATYGHIDDTSSTSEFNALNHVIKTAQANQMTCTIVKIMKITGGKGEHAAIGRVEVQPLVQMVDGIGKTFNHKSVFNLPYVRMAGGKNAVIIDPQKDDIGIVVSADSDISGVKKTKKQSPPGSARKFNIADGIYIGMALSEEPENVIRFKDDGTIIGSVGGKNNPCELVIAKDHVQMKKKGSPDMHITVDAAGGQLLSGKEIVIAPDPYPND